MGTAHHADMTKAIILGILAFVLALSASRVAQAQGTMTYLSNLGQLSVGSQPVGSNSWLAARFLTGPNRLGYSLDSIQLAMTDASGNPSGFRVMLCSNAPIVFGPGPVLGTLNGSLSPVSSGIYTYTPASDLTLKPGPYFIVITAGTAVADGAYEWSVTSTCAPVLTGRWNGDHVLFSSVDGLNWGPGGAGYAQFAISATAVPEPSILGMLALGGFLAVWHRCKRAL